MSKTIDYFRQITAIPRPSKKEWLIRNFLIDWAISRNYKFQVDSIWNLFIFVPAKNCDTKEAVILQAHLDMICVKTSYSNIDFETDALDIYEENWYIKARNTSLGADNGIGIALAMASTDFISHPPLELIFTINEEQGMSWVLNLDFSFLSWKKIINLDFEDGNEICISSAGWASILVKKNLKEKISNIPQYKLEIFGMKWGHSGVEIDKNQGNAIKLLIDFLRSYDSLFEIASIAWWTAENVIPSSAEAILWIVDYDIFESSLQKYSEIYKQNYDCPDLKYKITKVHMIKWVIEEKDILLNVIKEGDNWVLKMSEKIPSLVETSINLWMIHISDNSLSLNYLARSSNNEDFEKLLSKLEKYFNDCWYTLEIQSKYPGWQENPDGALVSIAREAFEKINWKSPEIIAIHAGLECGTLVGWIWVWTSAISIGPNMYDVHSVNERVEIASADKLEKILEEILEKI